METISVIIHTYNSGKYLYDCLESVKQADEIIICDMYSTDKTIEIAQQFNCKIIYHENVGYADPARNFAISQASGDWIFVVDSDEIVPDELWKFLREFIQTRIPSEVCVEMPRKNIVVGKILWSWYPNIIQRFWKKGCIVWPARVHEPPDIIGGGSYKIDRKRKELALIHYNYDSIEAFMSRLNKYSSLELEKFKDRNIKYSLPFLLFRPLGEFFKKFILKKGFMDGTHGFIFSVLSAAYEFVTIAKLYEKEFKEKNPNLKY
jgi:glycosyltransferase involved in cell wall biosynthesis